MKTKQNLNRAVRLKSNAQIETTWHQKVIARAILKFIQFLQRFPFFNKDWRNINK